MHRFDIAALDEQRLVDAKLAQARMGDGGKCLARIVIAIEHNRLGMGRR
nr:hypothetical protein [Sphingomonas sp. 66-10]